MRLLTTLTLAAVCTLAAGTLAAQGTRNVPDSLVSKAKISEDSARAIAQKKVPGDLQSTTLERVHRRLIWDFKIQRTGQTTASDVQVSAMSGKATVKAGTRAKKSTTRRSS